jgi:hypothetical protein
VFYYPGDHRMSLAPRPFLVTTLHSSYRVAQDYLLLRRLVDGNVTALQPYWLRRQGYLRLDSDGVAFIRTNSRDESKELCKDRSTWALIEDYPLDEFGWSRIRDWTFVWSASPEKHRASTWKKEMNAELLYMDTWSWEEVVAARYIPSPLNKATRAHRTF